MLRSDTGLFYYSIINLYEIWVTIGNEHNRKLHELENSCIILIIFERKQKRIASHIIWSLQSIYDVNFRYPTHHSFYITLLFNFQIDRI